MEESKATATDRLRREGRWNEASKFKDETIAQLRRDGVKRIDAQEAGWKAMIEKFPPLVVELKPESEVDLAGVDDLPNSSPDTFLTDCYFVLNSLGRPLVKAADAPTAGSWALYQWARGNQQKFFETILPRSLQVSTKLETISPDGEMERLSLEHVASLEEMLGMT